MNATKCNQVLRWTLFLSYRGQSRSISAAPPTVKKLQRGSKYIACHNFRIKAN